MYLKKDLTWVYRIYREISSTLHNEWPVCMWSRFRITLYYSVLGACRKKEIDKNVQKCYIFGYTNTTMKVWILSCTQNLNVIRIS